MPWSLPFGQWLSDEFIAEGGVIPRWYGVAWYCPYSCRVYCLPVPVNKLAGLCRNVWLWMKRPMSDPITDAYNYGKNIGAAEGYDAGCQHVLNLIATVKQERS